MSDSYKYEIGFSFLKQDEALAYQINDRLQDRLSSFIYSKKQEELGAKDGEKIFNEVFFSECRVVVVLYRDGWGNTPWTRIEETAIKNRAFEKGWDFLVLINLDESSKLPKWIPRTYIWVDYPRFKIDGAIAIVEQKAKEIGGVVRNETIQDNAERLKRHRAAELKKLHMLQSHEVFTAAHSELSGMINELKKLKSDIEDPSTNLLLSSQEGGYGHLMYQLGYQHYYLCFNNSKAFQYQLDEGIFTISLYESTGHFGINYREITEEKAEYGFDADLLENWGWIDKKTEKFYTSKDLVDYWIRKFIKGIKGKKATQI
jgi:hypothetical protein